MPIGKKLISVLAPRFGLSWWWERENQVTTQREIQCHSEIHREEVTRFPLSAEPCLPELPCQIKGWGGCLWAQWFISVPLGWLPVRKNKMTEPLVVTVKPVFSAPETCQVTLGDLSYLLSSPPPVSAKRCCLPLGSTLRVQLNTSPSLHQLETSCPSETKWLVSRGDEQLYQADCDASVGICLAVSSAWVRRYVHAASALSSNLWSYSWPTFKMWLFWVSRPSNMLPVLLCEGLYLVWLFIWGTTSASVEIGNGASKYGNVTFKGQPCPGLLSASHLNGTRGHRWLQGLVESTELDLKTLGTIGPEPCAALNTAFPFVPCSISLVWKEAMRARM